MVVNNLPNAKTKHLRRLARYVKDYAEVFDNEGHFLARHPSDMGPALHFHHTGNVLEGMAAFAAASGDLEYAQFAKCSYEWARSLGSPLVGFFPEYITDWPDDRPFIDWSGNCGNLTGAVGPFAIAEGLVQAPRDGTAEVRIWQANVGKRIVAHVPMQGGEVVEEGDFHLDGVTFPSAEIVIEYLDLGPHPLRPGPVSPAPRPW